MLQITDESTLHPEILHIESGSVISLPHGTGIDCNWEWDCRVDESLSFHNEWHVMDANGYYCGYVPFEVIITYINDEFHFDVSVDNGQIDSIIEDYEADEETGESNAPYLDDLGDAIWQSIDCWANYTYPRLLKERRSSHV